MRAKVEGFELVEAEIDAAERDAALVRARAHWLLALGELEEARRRPCLLLVGGLPGTGKSTLARGLAERADCGVIRSDIVRKELTGCASRVRIGGPPPSRRAFTLRNGRNAPTPSACGGPNGRCSRESGSSWTPRFGRSGTRRAFLDAARRWAVPALLLLCEADPGVVRARLEDRRGDASDADWAVHLQAAAHWEEPGPSTREAIRTMSTER